MAAAKCLHTPNAERLRRRQGDEQRLGGGGRGERGGGATMNAAAQLVAGPAFACATSQGNPTSTTPSKGVRRTHRSSGSSRRRQRPSRSVGSA